MKRFEYKRVYSVEEFPIERLNSLGNEGWELVVEFNYTWIFKRELIKPSKSKNQSSELYEDWGGGGE